MTTAAPLRETILSGDCRPVELDLDGVELRMYASQACGSNFLSTGTATLAPGAALPWHTHPFSEVITVISGTAEACVESRRYRLEQLDCIHIPRGVPHSLRNFPNSGVLVTHCAFASGIVTRDMMPANYDLEAEDIEDEAGNSPESIVRFFQAPVYELSEGAFFRDLFAKRLGSVGICGGYGEFRPGSSLPCHIHKFDESITIVSGEAVCLVQGRRYALSGCDTAHIPEGVPHRFVNQSSSNMAMIWVYAGDEPERTLVDPGYCSAP